MQVVYLGDTGRLFTTGFSKYNDRQYGVWSQNDLSTPLAMELVDSSSGERGVRTDGNSRGGGNHALSCSQCPAEQWSYAGKK